MESPRPLRYLRGEAGGEPADIVIEFARLSILPAPAKVHGPFSIYAPDLIDFTPGADISLRIERGRRITVDATGPLTPAELHGVLFGPAFTVLAQQRGSPPLHAGAISLGGAAIAIAGHSGAGKSTLVGALLRRGGRLLSDDQLMIEPSTALAYPSYPSRKLWRASAERLATPVDAAERVKAGFDKFHHDAADQFESDPRPLRALLVLASVPDLVEPDARRMTGGEAVAVIARLAHYGEIAAAIGLASTIMRNAALLAARVPIYHVRRSADFDQLDALVDLVLAQVSAPLVTGR